MTEPTKRYWVRRVFLDQLYEECTEVVLASDYDRDLGALREQVADAQGIAAHEYEMRQLLQGQVARLEARVGWLEELQDAVADYPELQGRWYREWLAAEPQGEE